MSRESSEVSEYQSTKKPKHRRGKERKGKKRKKREEKKGKAQASTIIPPRSTNPLMDHKDMNLHLLWCLQNKTSIVHEDLAISLKTAGTHCTLDSPFSALWDPSAIQANIDLGSFNLLYPTSFPSFPSDTSTLRLQS